MKNQYKVIKYKDKEYIISLTNKDEIFIFDKDKLNDLPVINYYLHNTYIYYTLENNNKCLHSLLMNYEFDGKLYVDHISRITTDNRISNLRLISQIDQNKNQFKRRRNIILPENSNINVQDIPTFIWYIKENSNHSDRWAVEIKNKYFWKTTSRKDLSTKCKFELAKKHLRNLINNKSDLFIGHCMNGELSDHGKKLEQEYIDILKIGGYDYDKNIILKNYLQENIDNLNEKEILILGQFEKQNEEKQNKIPKYCYYIKKSDKKGDGFCVTRLHPKQKEFGKDWTTTKSKKISTKEKFKQFNEYLNNNKYNPKEDIIIEKEEKKLKEIIPEDKFKLLDNQQLINIFNMKNGKTTTQETSDYIKENYKININRNFISKLWNNKLTFSKEIINLQEYKNMININENVIVLKKFSQDEIDWILQFNLDKSLGERVIAFQQSFNKTITKQYLSKLIKCNNLKIKEF